MNTNKWLLERSKVLLKYANVTPVIFNRMAINLKEPEYGWIDTCIKVNEKQKVEMELSSVYDPFVPLKKWMENIVREASEFTNGISMVNIDCEFYHVIIYYEPILFCDWKITQGRNCGILYIYDDSEEKIVLDAFCETEELLKIFYSSILRYAEEMQQCSCFIEDWVWSAYNGEVAELDEQSLEMKNFFYNKVRSRIVEEYLQSKNV